MAHSKGEMVVMNIRKARETETAYQKANIYAMPNDCRDAVRQDEAGGSWAYAADRRAACGVCGAA